jgi:hypothetical protein
LDDLFSNINLAPWILRRGERVSPYTAVILLKIEQANKGRGRA